MTGPTISPLLYRTALVVVTLLAWALRVLVIRKYVGLSASLDPADGLDELDYEQFAWSMSQGEGYVLADGTPSARRAPGTSLVMLPIYLIFGRALVAARLWFALLSALTCAAAAWVMRPKCGPLAALLSACAVAVNPGLFYYAVHLWSEAPFCLAATLATGCMLRAVERNSQIWTLLAGLCWAASVLLRPQIVFLAPCVLVAAIFVRSETRKAWFKELLCETLVVGLLIAPWIVRNALVIGKPTLTTLVGGHTFWGAHNGATFHQDRYRGSWKPHFEDPGITFPLSGNELEQERQAWDNAWICIRCYQHELPPLLLWKVYRLITPFEETANQRVYWAFALSWIVSIPCVIIGLIRLRRLDPALFAWIVLNLSAVLLCALVFYGAARFRHAVEPFLMMAAGVGLEFALYWPFRNSAPQIQEARNAGET